MTIVGRPSASASMVGGAIRLASRACAHGPARRVAPWTGEPGTSGTVAVIGAGKMGLPLAVQLAGHGWTVIAVDIDARVVEAVNAGRSLVEAEPGLAELLARVHDEGRLSATLDAAAAARQADVLVLIVPVMVDDEHRPDFRHMDAALASILPGVRPGTTIVFETTLPVGTTRTRFGPVIEATTGLVVDRDVFVAFSPERLFSGAVLENLAAYPKLVGGVGPASTDRAARFYASVLDAEVVAMTSAEAAELSKLADTTYRDVNIALANELARVADGHGVDIGEVIAAANSQPYSHIHQPGIGVGGHCIPVYPHLLLASTPGLELVETARRVNDAQVGATVAAIEAALGGVRGEPVLILGLTYRHGVKELAYSVALRLLRSLEAAGAEVHAYDALLSPEEVAAAGARPWTWGERGTHRAIVAQTADPSFAVLDAGWFPDLRILVDGRNALQDLALPPGVAYLGFGVQHRSSGPAAGA